MSAADPRTVAATAVAASQSSLPAGVAATAIHTICYAVWLGGVVAIGALVAPAVASVLRNPPPSLNADALRSLVTTGIIGAALRHLNSVTYVAGMLMLVCDAVEGRMSVRTRFRLLTSARAIITILLLGTVFYLGGSLLPRMDLTIAHKQMFYFDELHKQYEAMVIYVQTPLLVAIPLLTAWRNWSR